MTSLKSKKEMNFGALNYNKGLAMECQFQTVYWKGNYQWYSADNFKDTDIKLIAYEWLIESYNASFAAIIVFSSLW